jgi:hypothetical protein
LGDFRGRGGAVLPPAAQLDPAEPRPAFLPRALRLPPLATTTAAR